MGEDELANETEELYRTGGGAYGATGHSQDHKRVDLGGGGATWASEWNKTEDYIQPEGTNSYLYGEQEERELT